MNGLFAVGCALIIFLSAEFTVLVFQGWKKFKTGNTYKRLFDLNYDGNKFYKSFRWYLRMYKHGYYFSGLSGYCDFIRLNFERGETVKHAIVDIDYGTGESFGEFESGEFSHVHGGPENDTLFRYDSNDNWKQADNFRDAFTY